MEQDDAKLVHLQVIDGGKIDESNAMDLFFSVYHQTGCDRIAIDKDLLCAEFFDLKSRMAGEILQKCVNYQITLAIYGDFSVYQSRALRDFIYESNRGRHVFFVPSLEDAFEKMKSI